MAIKAFEFNSISSSTYGLYVSGVETYNAPMRVYEEIEIDGRNGNLLISKNRFANTEVTYHVGIRNTANIETVRNWLMAPVGYKRLEDDYHPNEYRLGAVSGSLDMDKLMHYASCDVTFNCKPQRWLKTGEVATTFTSDGTITNPTNFDSTPLIRVYGYGALGVGSETITIASHAHTYIDIDCETMDAYYGTTNCNSLITLSSGEFPVLESGSNGITLDANMTSVEITPRWWIV